jgi:hypothetical protein
MILKNHIIKLTKVIYLYYNTQYFYVIFIFYFLQNLYFINYVHIIVQIK